jgi:hypothetical protein
MNFSRYFTSMEAVSSVANPGVDNFKRTRKRSCVMYSTSVDFTAGVIFKWFFYRECACWILTDDPSNYRLYKTINCFIFVPVFVYVCHIVVKLVKICTIGALCVRRWEPPSVCAPSPLTGSEAIKSFDRNKSMRTALTIFSNFVIGLCEHSRCFLAAPYTERDLFIWTIQNGNVFNGNAFDKELDVSPLNSIKYCGEYASVQADFVRR